MKNFRKKRKPQEVFLLSDRGFYPFGFRKKNLLRNFLQSKNYLSVKQKS